ncbi:MAG: 2-oxo acid dehydrogenase subunit E2 [Chloroflexi bacterium]|nr:2-oxo acid dehydrogenase subunit E2 [Chloroflexota bacterium]
MTTNVVMPQLGESVVEGTVGKWYKRVGDAIAEYEPIMEVITDKVTTEIPAPAAGTLLQILVPEGTTVKAGTVVAVIGQADSVTSDQSSVISDQSPVISDQSPVISDQSPVTSDQSSVISGQSPKTDGSARNRFTPVVARMISEFNISAAELATIQGSGEGGRISKRDLENFLNTRERKQAASAPPPSAPLQANQDAFARQGVKLTYTAYLVEAAVVALKAMPLVNAQYSEQGVVMKRALNIGIAVGLEDGLIVPVLKDAADKSLLGIARGVNDLATRAREKKLVPDDVQGATFTLTNYGVFGSLFGTPIIPFGTTAILGVGAIQKRVVVIGDAIAIRPMVYLGLTFDHRLLDAAAGDRFMGILKEFLEKYQGT